MNYMFKFAMLFVMIILSNTSALASPKDESGSWIVPPRVFLDAYSQGGGFFEISVNKTVDKNDEQKPADAVVVNFNGGLSTIKPGEHEIFILKNHYNYITIDVLSDSFHNGSSGKYVLKHKY